MVASVRVHGGYVQGSKTGGDDVAVLTLTTALDLNGPTARAIALPGPSTALEFGDSVTLAGFGLKTINGTIDGTLNGMNGTLVDQSECLPPAYDTANGVLLCAFSGSSSPCSGDSGGALVLAGPTPVVVGVTRAASCSSNSVASYANVTAPEILEFIRGSDSPPTAPRPTTTTTLERPTPIMQVGQTVHCVPGTWSGGPSLSYQFREGATGTVLRSGPSAAYTLKDVDAGRTLLCRVLAVEHRRHDVRRVAADVLAGRERARPLRRADHRAARRDRNPARAARRLGAALRQGRRLRHARAARRRQGLPQGDAGGLLADGGHAGEGEGDGAAERPRRGASVVARAADGRTASSPAFVVTR